MKRFTRLLQDLDALPTTHDKVLALKHYFQAVSPGSAVWALYLLMGKGRKRHVTAHALRRYFVDSTAMPMWLFEACETKAGGMLEAISLLSEQGLGEAQPGDKSVEDDLSLRRWATEEIPRLRDLDEPGRARLLLQWWRSISTDEILTLNKMITGSIRVKVTPRLIIRGLARAFEVEETILTHQLVGDWEPNHNFFSNLVNRHTREKIASRPYPFFLAVHLDGPVSNLGPPGSWWAEWKWDGLRAQAIRRQRQHFIWSRSDEMVNDRFPSLVAMLEKLPNGTILDGEILAWSDDRPLPYSVLQKRLGRSRQTERVMEETPVIFMAYDILELEYKDLRTKPFTERRAILEKVMSAIDDPDLKLSSLLPFKTWDDLETHKTESRAHHAEGLMLKRMDSPYRQGRKRGDWWKLKADPYFLDAVLLYAGIGKGRQKDLFTDYTFALWDGDQLSPFARVYTGLNSEEVAELDRWIRENTTSKQGASCEVAQELVFEISFEGIEASRRHKSGISVRAPRIHRWRRDKKAAEADQLSTAKAFIQDSGDS